MAPLEPVAADSDERVRKPAAYACAFILPFIATWITTHYPEFHSIPFALHFAFIAGVASFGGLGPSLVAVVLSIASSNPHVTASSNEWSLSKEHIERAAALLLCAFFITFLAWKQRRTEAKLRGALLTLQSRTDALIEAQHGGESAAWVLDTETHQTLWYEGGTEIFGRPFKEMEQFASPIALVYPEDQQRVRDITNAAIQTGQPLQIEFRILWPNGDLHWLETRGVQVTGSGHLWRGVTFDVTRRKLVETALVRSEKLAAMGRLASTVAHEVNNPLEAVTNLLYLARLDSSLSEDTRSYLNLADEELARLANITRLTLTFVRSTGVRAPIDVAATVENVLGLFRRKCDLLNVAIQRFYTPGVTIEILEHELRQILINLISNAVDALSKEPCRLHLHVHQHGDHAVILIEDSGRGIPAANLPRVFDAFYTTKGELGTGIGLWVTKELVEKNGGEISVESGGLSEGMATRFCLRFPCSKDSVLPDGPLTQREVTS
ncbi:PAS domain-containing sensor histidine kinase [Granulicella sp. L60]|uniref:sensor histidine kinase n=1 Tax=Granulicella sp. L60 TaxID=1641866 RepID=UPI00131D2C81|nr:PAS domain-containing sensor histidine kinase [Granulicella sp. L60]